MKYEIHELANLFPMLSGKEYERLRDDIKVNGVQLPVVLYDGKVLDGRNRLRACEDTGVEIKTEIYTGGDPLGFVISANVHRRQMNTSQRAMVAAGFANMRQGERTDKEPSANLRKVSQADAAKMMMVTERLVTDATVIKDKGTPKQIESVVNGKMRIAAVIREINGTPKKTKKAVKDNNAVSGNSKVDSKFDPSIVDCLDVEVINVEGIKRLPPSVQGQKAAAAIKTLVLGWNDRGRRAFFEPLRELILEHLGHMAKAPNYDQCLLETSKPGARLFPLPDTTLMNE